MVGMDLSQLQEFGLQVFIFMIIEHREHTIKTWVMSGLRICEHLINGSPVSCEGQLQIGLWFITWHLAPIPQVPGQGSLHFWFMHASAWAQSVLTTHSGLHVGGLPMYPVTHVQTAKPLISLHWLFGPHGDGLQGCVVTGSIQVLNIRNQI